MDADLLAREELRKQLFGGYWKHRIPEVFCDVWAYYDKGNRLASLGLCNWWSEQFVGAMRIPHGARVLDVASGTNDIPMRLLARDPTLRIDAVDRSAEMMAEGARRAAKAGYTVGDGCMLAHHISDVHKLPFDDATFDAVTLQFATRHLRVGEVFNEIHRVLKPGGVFYHNDMLRPQLKPIEECYLLFLRASVWLTAQVYGSSQASRLCIGYFADAIRHFYTPEEMTQLMHAIGFREIRHREFLTGALAFHIGRKP
jgi:demethylmenaquinone methyltransferase/2-methoxy-6-polyprenyl-1,4-benzoquinol methylase